jgi:hypothetical protein
MSSLFTHVAANDRIYSLYGLVIFLISTSTTFPLSIYLLMGTWVAPSPGIVCNKPVGADDSLRFQRNSFPLDVHPAVGQSDHVVDLF